MQVFSYQNAWKKKFQKTKIAVDTEKKFCYTIICREGKNNSREMRYAEVSELADEQD